MKSDAAEVSGGRIHHRSTSSRRRLGGRGGRSADPATIAVLFRRRRIGFRYNQQQLVYSSSIDRKCSLHSGAFTTAPAQSRAFLIVGPLRSTSHHIHGSTESKYLRLLCFKFFYFQSAVSHNKRLGLFFLVKFSRRKKVASQMIDYFEILSL